MKRLALFLFLLLGFFNTADATETAKLQDVLMALELPFHIDPQQVKGPRIDKFQADFLQESHIASIGRTQYGKGSVSFRFLRTAKTEDAITMFRWLYREPAIQEIVSDGQTMWFYLPENKQVIESEMSQVSGQQGENPVTFLSGLGNLSRDFSVEWAEEKHDPDGNPVLTLRPRKASQYIDRLEVVVARQVVEDFTAKKRIGRIFPILTTIVVDPNGNRTALSFIKVKINQDLSDEMFRFQRPAGVEVVRSSEQGLSY